MQCDNDVKYECFRQQWDTLNRPKYQDKTWSKEQKDAIDFVKDGVPHEACCLGMHSYLGIENLSHWLLGTSI